MLLGISPVGFWAGAAAVALAAWPVAVASSAAAGIVLLTVVVAAALAAEARREHATVEA